MTTVIIHPHGKFREIARRLFARLLGMLRSLPALKPYRPETHYMRGRSPTEARKTAADDRPGEPGDQK